MTGFDETVPPDTEIDRDGTAVAENATEHDLTAQQPEHDSAAPAFEYDADPDEAH